MTGWGRPAATQAARALGNHTHMSGLACTAVGLVMAALCLSALHDGREEALDHARKASAALVAVVSGDIARELANYDLSLRAMTDSAKQSGTWNLPPELRRDLIFDGSTDSGYVGGAYILDASGGIRESQDGRSYPHHRVDDREYFQAHAHLHAHANTDAHASVQAQPRFAEAGLYVSHPYRSQMRGQQWSFALSRRIDKADGTFDGVALLAIRLEYLQRLLGTVETGKGGSAFIMFDDGTLMARVPHHEHDIGRNVADSAAFAYAAAHDKGSYTATSALDGVQRIYTFARVGHTPLIAVVAPAQDDALSAWQNRMLNVGVPSLALSALFILVSWMLVFALRDRISGQHALARLTVTDALTGLINRHHLEVRLAEEWSRARQMSTTVAALVIDIDHFRRTNDAFGYAAGDDALRAVAGCVATMVGDTRGLVARSGGDEFVVILPDASAPVVGELAERIRREVERTVRVGERPAGELTVSVGCATRLPMGGGSAPELLNAADKQLYQAKDDGCNCVRQDVSPI